MKVLKIFLIIGLAFLLGAAGAAGYVWYLVQDALSLNALPVAEQVDGSLESVDTQTQQTFNGSVANTVPTEGIALPPDALSVQQKAIAESLGIAVDSFILTPQMVDCAEEKLGTERIEEIMAGDAPTVFESARLATCL